MAHQKSRPGLIKRPGRLSAWPANTLGNQQSGGIRRGGRIGHANPRQPAVAGVGSYSVTSSLDHSVTAHHAAIFISRAETALSSVPKFTLNCAGWPRLVERTAVIW